jgi:hypothetical protein
VTPIFIDLCTGRVARADDQSVYWWTEGNGACDCNRVIHFEGVYEEMDAAMRKAHPEMKEWQSYCYGCKRFVAIEVEGDLDGETREQILARMNSEYPARIVQ